MRVVVTEFVTLDGIMEAPGGEEGHPHTGWVFDFHDSELEAFKLDETLAVDAHLLGRCAAPAHLDPGPGRLLLAVAAHVASSVIAMPELPVFPAEVVLRAVSPLEAIEHVREGLTECIGCGCLSLDRCRLANPGDRLARRGPGPVAWAPRR